MIKRTFSPLQLNAIYVVLFILIAWFYGNFDTMDRGPYSRHQWRQSDCLSITQHYYQDNLPFLEPEIHWRGEGQSGKTISEFPIVYYTVGNIWKVTGKHYWIYRLINFIILGLGLYYLKKLAQKILGDNFWSIFIPLLLFSSPILAYYGNNFLMNVNALSLAIIACYHFYRHRTEKSYKHLVYACMLFLFAGLLKITSLMLFFGLGAIFLYEMLVRERSLKIRWKELIPYTGALLLILGWYSYTGHYNANNMSMVFLQGLLPIWDISSEDIYSNWKLLHSDLLPEYFNVSALFLLAMTFIGLLVNRKKAHPYLLALMILTSLGIGVYFVLFFQVFNVHEYYLINLLVIIPLMTLLILHFLKKNHVSIFNSKAFKVTASIGLLFLIYSAGVRTQVKYDVGPSWIKNSAVLDKPEVEFWQWYHWNYGNTYKELETIEPYLESLGIGKKDKVISMPDGSITITLNLMNRNGYNDYGYHHIPKKERIEKQIEWGAKYLVVNDTSILGEDYMQPFILNKIGATEHVFIYKL